MKEKLIEIVKATDCAENMKEMVLSYIENAYTIGFNDGMQRAHEIQLTANEMIFKSLNS